MCINAHQRTATHTNARRPTVPRAAQRASLAGCQYPREPSEVIPWAQVVTTRAAAHRAASVFGDGGAGMAVRGWRCGDGAVRGWRGAGRWRARTSPVGGECVGGDGVVLPRAGEAHAVGERLQEAGCEGVRLGGWVRAEARAGAEGVRVAGLAFRAALYGDSGAWRGRGPVGDSGAWRG
eukprot:1901891-Prymnesium_polylepis.1